MENVKLRNAIIRVLLESRSDEQVTYIADKIINFCLIEKTEPVAEVPCSVGLDCPTMEDCQYVDWAKRDKDIMADALRDIYNIRGEDKDIERIVNEAMDRGCAI